MQSIVREKMSQRPYQSKREVLYTVQSKDKERKELYTVQCMLLKKMTILRRTTELRPLKHLYSQDAPKGRIPLLFWRYWKHVMVPE